MATAQPVFGPFSEELFNDPYPTHRRMRSLVNKVFTPARSPR